MFEQGRIHVHYLRTSCVVDVAEDKVYVCSTIYNQMLDFFLIEKL